MALELPADTHRLRCGRCGNLTRFDVVRTVTAREFWHADMAGDVVIEQSESLAGDISSITCRWCGATDEIEHVLKPSAGGTDSQPEGIA